MATSINGWPVLQPTSTRLVTKTIPGTTRKIKLRGDVAPLFLALAADYHKKIAPIDTGTFDDWGYAYREANAADAWSDHSSGTAMDLNATKEGRMGTGPYSWWNSFNRALKARTLKAKYGLFIWGGAASLGGDYRLARNYDWMHWALKPGTNIQQVRAKINALGIKPDGTYWPTTRPVVSVAKVQPGMTNSQVLVIQKALAKEVGLDYSSAPGRFGPATQAAWKKWEAKLYGTVGNSSPNFDSVAALGNKYGFKATP